MRRIMNTEGIRPAQNDRASFGTSDAIFASQNSEELTEGLSRQYDVVYRQRTQQGVGLSTPRLISDALGVREDIRVQRDLHCSSSYKSARTQLRAPLAFRLLRRASNASLAAART